MPQRPKTQNTEQKQYYNEFSKDFKKQLILKKKKIFKKKTEFSGLGESFPQLILNGSGVGGNDFSLKYFQLWLM